MLVLSYYLAKSVISNLFVLFLNIYETRNVFKFVPYLVAFLFCNLVDIVISI